MDEIIEFSGSCNPSNVDFNIHHLELQYNTLNRTFQHTKHTNNESPQYHVMLNLINSISKTLFILQRKVQLASADCEKQLTSLEERIKAHGKGIRKCKKISKRTNIFTVTKPNLSFYFQSTTRYEKDNLDYNSILQSGHRFLSDLPSPKPWRTYDKQKLYDCVRRSIVNQQSAKLVEKMNKVYDLVNSTSDRRTLNILQKSCEKLVTKMAQVRNSLLVDLLMNYPNCEFDWESISEHDFRKRFTADECKMMWELVANPLIIRKPWSKAEDFLLYSTADQYNRENWDIICEKLNNGRTPFLCFIRYQNYLRKSTRGIPKKYTHSENNLVEKFIDRKYVNEYHFSNLITQFRDVNRRQLKNHIKYVKMAKGKRRGKFNSKDKFLINFFTKKGHSCKKIAQLVQNRTPKQIYDFQINSRIKSVDQKWSHREIQKLLNAVKYNGANRWTEISKYLINRSASSCCHKYRWLKSRYPHLIEKYTKSIPSIKEIQSMLRDRRCISSTKSRYLDDEIEAYFIEYLEKEDSFEKDVDKVEVADSVVNILKFLGFKVESNIDQRMLLEIGEWLVNFNESSETGGSCSFDDIFKNLTNCNKNLKLSQDSTFTKLVPKTCPVLPPNKCTMYGLNALQKNLQNYCASVDANFENLWNNINSSNSQKEFMEAKLILYRIMKGLFYWPIKLNNIPPDMFL